MIIIIIILYRYSGYMCCRCCRCCMFIDLCLHALANQCEKRSNQCQKGPNQRQKRPNCIDLCLHALAHAGALTLLNKSGSSSSSSSSSIEASPPRGGGCTCVGLLHQIPSFRVSISRRLCTPPLPPPIRPRHPRCVGTPRPVYSTSDPLLLLVFPRLSSNVSAGCLRGVSAGCLRGVSASLLSATSFASVKGGGSRCCVAHDTCLLRYSG
jgi:hypothetical protein